MTGPKLTRVVRIRSGEVIDAAIEADEWLSRIWRPEHLKKDGGFPLNRYADGGIARKGSICLQDWAIYQAEREAQAQPIRDHIVDLHTQIEQAERELLSIYKEG